VLEPTATVPLGGAARRRRRPGPTSTRGELRGNYPRGSFSYLCEGWGLIHLQVWDVHRGRPEPSRLAYNCEKRAIGWADTTDRLPGPPNMELGRRHVRIEVDEPADPQGRRPLHGIQLSFRLMDDVVGDLERAGFHGVPADTGWEYDEGWRELTLLRDSTITPSPAWRYRKCRKACAEWLTWSHATTRPIVPCPAA
jgi:hypothetical protein